MSKVLLMKVCARDLRSSEFRAPAAGFAAFQGPGGELCRFQVQDFPFWSGSALLWTGITNFLENDGTLEAAQRIAGHADSRTTKLYDRRGQKVLL